MQNIIQAINNGLKDKYSQSEIRVMTNLILHKEFNLSPADILTHKHTNFSDSDISKIEEIMARLQKSEPIQYILGETEFYNLKFKVNPHVLIPRPETEELIEWIISDNEKKTPTILDIGTGSGCIAITLAKKISGARVHGWDISEEALKTATDNAQLNKTIVAFAQKNILNERESNISFDIIVSNPPYIAENEKKDMESNVLDYEPHIALFTPNEDPLIFYHTIADFAMQGLASGGILYFEIGYAKGDEVISMLNDKGYQQPELRHDLSGNPRMIKAIKPL